MPSPTLEHRARLGDERRLVEVLDLLLDDLRDLFGSELHGFLERERWLRLQKVRGELGQLGARRTVDDLIADAYDEPGQKLRVVTLIEDDAPAGHGLELVGQFFGECRR